ncbi:MAG: hypothetical protein L0213_04540, partial [Candidatus Dadabacteria bacterium]|nr:hypothetical protein [Candidatus Dadabacteria bacterium]
LDSLKEDINNLNAVVDQRAKEIQLAVKKNTELVLEEVGEDLERAEAYVQKRFAAIQAEGDEARKGAMLADLNERLTSLGDELSLRIDELRESGAEASRQALEEAQKQVEALSKAVKDLAEKFPFKVKVTPGKEAKAPEKAAPAQAKKVAKKPSKKA